MAAGQRFDGVWVFVRQDAETNLISQLVNSALRNHPEFMQLGPQLEHPILSADMVARISQFMDRHFIWTAGTWAYTLSFTVNGRQLVKKGAFELAESQVRAIRHIASYYIFGYELVFGSHLQAIGNAILWSYVSSRETG